MLEADLKRTITDYLQYGQNQGKWWFTRLNSGEAFVKKGNKFHKIQLCEKGTADFVVIKGRFMEDGRRFGRPLIIFLELKSGKGRWSPEQRAFKVMVEGQGCKYHIVRSIEEIAEVL